MKIIYLASHKAKLNINHQVIYQDKFIQRDLGGDMLDIDLTNYDLIIATPPCNYYSRANYRRDQSKYALETKHLLPMILNKLQRQNKPYIVENVRNPKLMQDIIKSFNGFIYIHGRHTYFTNYMFVCSDIKQVQEYKATTKRFKNGKYLPSGQIALFSRSFSEGGSNVNKVLERFIQTYENSN